MSNLRFTKHAVEAIQRPASGQVIYRDTQLRGFGLRVGTKSKVYIAEGQVNGRTCRTSIGRADVFCPDVARKLALAALSEMAMGRNPNEVKRREKLTLEQAFEVFFKARDSLAPQTVDHYRRAMNLYLFDWRSKPLAEITRQMVLVRHQRIAKQHGKATANNAMRQLRSVYNFTAAAHDEDARGFDQDRCRLLPQVEPPRRRARRQGRPGRYPADADPGGAAGHQSDPTEHHRDRHRPRRHLRNLLAAVLAHGDGGGRFRPGAKT